MTRKHFDANLPGPFQSQWDLLAKFRSPEEIEELKSSQLNANQVSGLISAHYRELMSQFPVGSTITLEGKPGPFVIQQYLQYEGGRNFRVQLLGDNVSQPRNIQVLLEATLAPESNADSRAAGWEALRKRVKKIAQEEIRKFPRPLDTSSTEEWAMVEVTKKLAKGKRYTSTDAPEVTDDEIRERVEDWLSKKYGK